MHPELATTIGGKLEVLHANALDTSLVSLDQDSARATGNAEHLEAQRGHGHALGLQEHRHTSDDAVTLWHNGENTTSGGGLFQRPDIAEQPIEFVKEGYRIFAEHGKAGH